MKKPIRMIIKEILWQHLAPLFTIGGIVKIYIWSPFRWHIYLIIERKPVKLPPGPMKDLDEYWKKEFKAMRRKYESPNNRRQDKS